MSGGGWFLLFALLQALDVWTTLAVLERGGRELNPLLRRAFAAIGPAPALILIKLALVGAVYAATVCGLVFPWVMALVCLGYGAVVINNLRALRAMRRRREGAGV